MTVRGLPGLVLVLMKIRVHYRQDLSIVAVSQGITYNDLAEKVGEKMDMACRMRLLGPNADLDWRRRRCPRWPSTPACA